MNRIFACGRKDRPMKGKDLAHKMIDCAYQSPRSGYVFQSVLPERTDIFDPSNPVNSV